MVKYYLTSLKDFNFVEYFTLSILLLILLPLIHLGLAYKQTVHRFWQEKVVGNAGAFLFLLFSTQGFECGLF